MAELFEYKIIVSDSDDETDEETLNQHGAQGWELVNAVADVRANDDAERRQRGRERPRHRLLLQAAQRINDEHSG